jgi:hypothetical protein
MQAWPRASARRRPNVALQLTGDAKELRLLAALAGAHNDGSLAAELWR